MCRREDEEEEEAVAVAAPAGETDGKRPREETEVAESVVAKVARVEEEVPAPTDSKLPQEEAVDPEPVARVDVPEEEEPV